MAFVVFAGQSNTGGAYMNASTLPGSWAPDPLTLIWNEKAGAWEQMAPGVNTGFGPMPEAWGPEVQFAIEFRAAHPDEVLRIVKSAWGGAPLAPDEGAWKYDWSPRSQDEIFDATTQMIDRAALAAGGVARKTCSSHCPGALAKIARVAARPTPRRRCSGSTQNSEMAWSVPRPLGE